MQYTERRCSVTRRQARPTWNKNDIGAFTAAAWLSSRPLAVRVLTVVRVSFGQLVGDRPPMLCEPARGEMGRCSRLTWATPVALPLEQDLCRLRLRHHRDQGLVKPRDRWALVVTLETFLDLPMEQPGPVQCLTHYLHGVRIFQVCPRTEIVNGCGL